MSYKESQKLHTHDDASIVRSLATVPVTEERVPFLQPDGDERIPHIGLARANVAPSYEKPEGTEEGGWRENNKHRTVLQQHILFFDRDDDGVIWPYDTFVAFYKLGFGLILSAIAVLVIHGGFSYPTLPTWIPDPFFRIYVQNIHKDKHGSDTGTYDTEGRYIPQKFEDVFAKYASGEEKDCLTTWDITKLMKGQRLVLDPFGWTAQALEWFALYYMIWPEDGKMRKEDVRKMYDGSLFFDIAERREGKKQGHRKNY